jgi:pimeloyl-ACP methyl ester carboxylesterase
VVVLACDPPNVIEHYDDVFRLLAPSYRVLCLELPGFGFSRPVPGFRFTIDEYGATVEEVLGELGSTPAPWPSPASGTTSR